MRYNSVIRIYIISILMAISLQKKMILKVLANNGVVWGTTMFYTKSSFSVFWMRIYANKILKTPILYKREFELCRGIHEHP